MQNYLLYNASEGIHRVNECRYALLKLLSVYNLKPPPGLCVVVHTAQPRLFDDFLTFFPQIEMEPPVAVLPHSKAQLIQNFFSSRQGNLLICDTATYPLKPLESLFQQIEKGELFLYKREHPQTNGRKSIPKKIQTILSRSQPKMNGLPRETGVNPLFDSAVAGLNHSMINVLNSASGQASQKQPSIKTANDYFADYFDLSEFRTLLHTFFTKNEEESIPSLVKLVNLLDVNSIQKEKTMHSRLPLLKKWWNELTGKGWSIRKYEKKIS